MDNTQRDGPLQAKRQAFPVHDMKIYGMCGGIAPLILDRGTTWRQVTPRTLPSRGNPGTQSMGGALGPRSVWTL